MTRRRYTLADLLTLAARLAAPLLDPIRRDLGRVRTTPRTAAANPAPAATPTAASSPAAPAYPAGDNAISPTMPAAATSPADRPEACYVRRGQGLGTRYVAAAPGEPGELFRRRVKAGRARYEAVR